jgi:hypothetical protein
MNYFMVRIDPDKITALNSETESKEYRSEPADGWE